MSTSFTKLPLTIDEAFIKMSIGAWPTLDTVPPTMSITSNSVSLVTGQTALITFTLNERSTNFVVGDITVTGGAISNFAGSGMIYTATFTPNTLSTTNGVISVASNKFSDPIGNFNVDGADVDNTLTITINTVPPTIAITTSAASLGSTQTALITFTLSKASTDFVVGDITVSGGTLTNFAGSGSVYTAIFTPNTPSTSNGVVSVISNKFSDLGGLLNVDGADANNTVTMTVDAVAPTISVTSSTATLTTGQTATITFTLSEASIDFLIGDITVTGGTLGSLSGNSTSYTSIFTPTASSTTNGVVSVTSTKFSDAFGNFNVDGADANNIVTMTVDTTISLPPIVQYLVIGGGGAGGGRYLAGGGGAGGYRTSTGFNVNTATNYTVTVGAGGAGNNTTVGGPGIASVFSTISSAGGGGGGWTTNPGGSGGSGGGASGYNDLSGAGNTPATSPSQGNSGGTGGRYGGAGGGGAGAVGNPGFSNNGGSGGAGTASSITGSSVFRAGGGGGGCYLPGGVGGDGGTGGGGAGAPINIDGVSGTVNTGGGGGGVGNDFARQGTGGSGGSGVVILKYQSNYTITIGAGLTGSTAAPSGGFKVTTITAGTGNVSWS